MELLYETDTDTDMDEGGWPSETAVRDGLKKSPGLLIKVIILV